MLKEIICIFMGSGLGGITRYGLGKWVNTFHSTHFPLGTLAVNVLACFFLGLIIGMASNRYVVTASTKMFWVVGFCGGFSTFSTFSNEALHLLQTGHQTSSGLYIILSLVVSFSALWIGLTVAHKF